MAWLKHGFLLLLLLTSPAAARDGIDDLENLQDTRLRSRQEFVSYMAQITLAILQDTKKPFAERKILLRNAFKTVVDIDWIARFVLGRAWNAASAEQKERYTALYRTYLTENYVSHFGENPDRRIKDIKILGIQDAEDGAFMVHTDMKLASMEEMKVSYRVSDRNDKYKVIDIIIENISLLATHRQEFSQAAAAQGVEGVIRKLEHTAGGGEHALNMSMN